MQYHTFSILIGDERSSRWIDVTAVSIEAAKADVAAAYDNASVIQWKCNNG